MSNIATITGNVPAHITSLFAQLAGINKEATDGISAGMYPIIKLNGTRFVLVKDNIETSVKSLEMRVVVLRARPGFEKRFYAGKYDPNSGEAKAPDCFSSNGTAPEAGCNNPQNSTCAGCKQNMFGTGTDQNGNPGKGKACSDRKLLAVLYPNPDTKALEIYGLSLPPASLKKWAQYVDSLSKNGIPLPAATTTIGFDDKSSYPVLTFTYSGVLGEKELTQIVPMINGDEVSTIIDSPAPAISTVPPAQSVKPETSAFGFSEAVAEPTPEPVKEKKERKLKAVEKPAPPVAQVEEVEEEGDTDEAIKAMLGLVG